MDKFDDGCFSINQRLAALVYADLQDCYRDLGHSTHSLDSLEGVGLSMMLVQLVSKGLDISGYYNRDMCRKLIKISEELCTNSTVEINIQDHDDEFRFAFIFGTVHGEYEWVERYSTHMYRWASLIAKADGTVSDSESATLAAIMKMKEHKSDGNVRVSGSGRMDDSHCLKAESMRTDEPPPKRSKESLAEVLKNLDALIGLEPVKKEVKQLANFIDIQKRRVAKGLKAAPLSYHCVFTGNPGTGKTTVARILADIYREMGVVKKGHLVETDRSGLIGEYVGQTAVKTNKVIDSAIDGVLFIDEAYTLVQGGQNDYGREAIATLLKRMEDDRDRLVVILAGYTDEMKQFIDSNPGLQSRFNRYIAFPDYSAPELAQIFLLRAENSQYACDEDVRNSIVQIMERAVAEKNKNFGNGRYVRNLFENAIQRQAVRLSTVAPLTTEMLTELTLHDLSFVYDDASRS